jgi:voltage-gated potassium channel
MAANEGSAIEGVDDLQSADDRLDEYLRRTQTPLDVLALATLWLVVVPPSDFGNASTIAFAGRVALSLIYAVDITIRTSLAPNRAGYLRRNTLSIAVVVFPPLRVVFSIRLVSGVFRRGNLTRFLFAASVLALDGAIVVWLFERHATGSNIHTLGQSIWWAVTTVSTVGYGDYYPVTTAGQIAAACIMAIGILTLAVVTAQVASSFVDQAARRRAGVPDEVTEGSAADPTMADLDQRLARIEALLATRDPGRG